MANAVLSAPHFQDEGAAFDYVEAHLWPKGPVCPHCGEKERIGRLQGKTTRPGLRKCYACRKPFTVRIGSIFEDSHLPLHLWLQVMHLMSASKKGISTRQVQRMLRCSMKTAWHLTHRIRLAMADGGDAGPLGGSGKVVEVDETYFGDLPDEKRALRRHGRPLPPLKRGPSHKRAILSLVERGGEARSFYVENAPVEKVVEIVRANVAKESRLHTDESHLYRNVGKEFAEHETVVHSKKEYARGDVTTNTVEGFYSVFKRGMKGVYQQCSEKHLHRYLAEFDFRYSAREALGVNDQQRTSRAVMGAKSKRLTHETVDGA
jgi:transposase-like protein